MALDKVFKPLFKMRTSIGFIKGRKGSGKTDFGFRILEDALESGYIHKIASNCEMLESGDSRVEFIMYYDSLEDWLKTPGRKGYLLDEMGINLYKMSFMSKQAKMILKVCQLSRKYKCHLVGMAPTEKLVNSLLVNSDILDYFVVKTRKHEAKVLNILTGIWHPLSFIPRTTINFNTDYEGLFEMKSPARARKIFDGMDEDEQIKLLYAKYKSARKAAKVMGRSHTWFLNKLNKMTTGLEFPSGTGNLES